MLCDLELWTNGEENDKPEIEFITFGNDNIYPMYLYLNGSVCYKWTNSTRNMVLYVHRIHHLYWAGPTTSVKIQSAYSVHCPHMSLTANQCPSVQDKLLHIICLRSFLPNIQCFILRLTISFKCRIFYMCNILLYSACALIFTKR